MKTETKHTPGPWQFWEVGIPFSGFEITTSDPVNKNYVGVARVPLRSPTAEQAKANAALIASAPDLLALVKEIGSLLDDHSLPGNNPINWANAHSRANLRLSAIWNQARAALAKCEPQQPQAKRAIAE